MAGERLCDVIAGVDTTEELVRIIEAYLREHDMPMPGRRLNADLCNAAVSWWHTLHPEQEAG